ncbi:MAG: hypothetical protein LiPW16_308 [Microgenomates group bacterium LiPW_16]|nr:MAG: hypothetical protein LiPW16_308 [Microgenomates group bacterium LiPW_16]
MATLTETAYYTRRAINWGIVLLLAILIAKVILNIVTTTWRKIHPPPPPPPTVAFGKLPPIKFPPPAGGASPSAKLNFTLETIEGKPPVASPTATVFFMPKPAPNLLSLTRARQFANRLGFKGEPQAESQTIYRWQDEQEPLRTVRIDIVDGNFQINYDYVAGLSVFAEKNLPTGEQAIAEAKNFLQNLGLYTPALAKGEVKISYWQLIGNNLIQTTSLANADAVRADLAREEILGLKLFPPNPSQELVHFIFSGSRQPTKRILKASYKFWEIETEQRATYPLKTSAQAWEELKNGGGFIARLQSPGGEATGGQAKIIIRKIYLAYFYPEEHQNFLQPIFVFEGDPSFMAFIPAVSPAWVGQ